MSSNKTIPDIGVEPQISEQVIDDKLYMEQKQKEAEKFYQESIQRAVEEKKRDNEFRENIAAIAKNLDDFVDTKMGKSNKELAVEVALKYIETCYANLKSEPYTGEYIAVEVSEIIKKVYKTLVELESNSKMV